MHDDPRLKLAITMGATIDLIDSHECESSVVAGCIAKILLDLEYSEVISYAAARVTVDQLGTEFAKSYWKVNDYRSRLTTVMAAVETAIKIIEDGEIDEDTKKATADALAGPE